jgi:hypothetical protein
VRNFLVELYISRTDAASFHRAADSARRAAERLNRQGTPVRHLRSIFVPQDETGFLLYEAATVESVQEVVERASLPFVRISEAVSAEPDRIEATSTLSDRVFLRKSPTKQRSAAGRKGV